MNIFLGVDKIENLMVERIMENENIQSLISEKTRKTLFQSKENEAKDLEENLDLKV